MWNTKSKQLENKIAIVCKVQRKDGAGRGEGEGGKPTLTLNCQRTLFPPVEENQW